MVGGGGRKLLTVAGRQADIVQVNARHLANGPADPAEFCSPDLFLQKIDWIRAAAGDRFEDIELGVQMLLLAVTDDPEQAVTEFLAKFMPQLKRLGSSIDIDPDALISSPLTALGSVEEVCDRLLEIREKFGFSYFSVPASSEPEALQPVIQKLTGV
jgi:alkanesulfonate monooxygenase SsuD/methylene tetrahydromethanopterin reductase-like flavin-dependent oxidoreductase (luciferase family)